MNIKELLIQELKNIAGVLGHTPTQREYEIHSRKFKSHYLIDTFGNWNKSLWAAGLTPNMVKIKALDKEALIAKLKEVAIEIGHTPTQKEFHAFKQRGVPSTSQYKRVFGTFTAAVVAAGLKPVRFEKVVGDRRKIIIDWMRNFYMTRNSLPTVLELQACKDAPSHHVIRLLFGSYTQAVKEAGFVPRIPGQNRTTYKGGRFHGKKNRT